MLFISLWERAEKSFSVRENSNSNNNNNNNNKKKKTP